MANVPTARLSLIVSAADVHRLNLLADFAEQGHTVIGQAINVSLHAPNGPPAPGLMQQIGALGIPFEGHAQVDGRDYLIAGDGNQTMALPPLRCDGSVDLVRLRQSEWHAGFLVRVRAKMGD